MADGSMDGTSIAANLADVLADVRHQQHYYNYLLLKRKTHYQGRSVNQKRLKMAVLLADNIKGSPGKQRRPGRVPSAEPSFCGERQKGVGACQGRGVAARCPAISSAVRMAASRLVQSALPLPARS